MNNLGPPPQLKQSNLPSTFYLLNGWDTRATDSIIENGQKDTEASIPVIYNEQLRITVYPFGGTNEEG